MHQENTNDVQRGSTHHKKSSKSISKNLANPTTGQGQRTFSVEHGDLPEPGGRPTAVGGALHEVFGVRLQQAGRDPDHGINPGVLHSQEVVGLLEVTP